MAKKADEEIADPYERIIRDMIPNCRLFKDENEDNWSDLTYINGWQLVEVPSSPLNAVAYESSIDLSGYANQSLTFFPETGFLQQSPIHRVNTAADDATGIMLSATIISTVPLDMSVLINQLILSSGPTLIGFNDPTVVTTSNDFIDWSQLLWCQISIRYANNTLADPSIMQVVESQQIGSLSATAADKLYVYAIATGNGTGMTSMTIPSMRLELIRS